MFNLTLEAWAPQMPALNATIAPDRGAIALCKTAGLIVFVLYSIYLKVCEGSGTGTQNNATLVRVATHITNHGLPWLAAGDFNNDRQAVRCSPTCVEAGGVVRSVQGGACFYKANGKCSATNMHVVGPMLARLTSGATANKDAGIIPRSPVTLKISDSIAGKGVPVLRPSKVFAERPESGD